MLDVLVAHLLEGGVVGDAINGVGDGDEGAFFEGRTEVGEDLLLRGLIILLVRGPTPLAENVVEGSLARG